MPETDSERLRLTFDEDAERYERAGPTYPSALFDDLAALACIGPTCRVLEIGCGTGQATASLAERGCTIVCVELGPRMAAVARRKLARFGSVQVEVAAFEDWPLPSRPFDTVVAATAFHWIQPAVRVGKCADALRAGGALAPERRRGLLACVADLIDRHYAGRIRKRYMSELRVAYARG
jgi:protein-L-isoaspartate O-methyltransferase